MKRVALALLMLASLAFAPAALASHGAPSGFVGNWTSVDCATYFEEPFEVRCLDSGLAYAWGDGSLQTLHIGHGDAPRVTYRDSYAIICANAESPSTRWVGAGTGEYVVEEYGLALWVNLTKTGCGNYVFADEVVFSLSWCCEDGSIETLFSDPDGDGWGTLWYRAG